MKVPGYMRFLCACTMLFVCFAVYLFGGEPAQPKASKLKFIAKEIYRHKSANSALDVAFSPKGELLASCSAPNHVSICDAKTGEVLVEIETKLQRVGTLTFVDAGKQLVLSDASGTVTASNTEYWNVGKWQRHSSVPNVPGMLCPGGQLRVSWLKGVLMFHNPYSGRVVREFKFEQYSLSVNSVKLSHNGKYLAARQPKLPNVDIWDLELEKKTAVLKGHEKEIVAMCLNPSGEKLATSSRDGTVRIWETATEKLIKTIMVDVPPEVIAFAPDGKRIAMGGLRGGVISVREADSWDEIALLKPELGYTRVLAFHPDGSRLAAATGRFVHVWQISDKPK